jgi:ketosteroid isomerase-like protein
MNRQSSITPDRSVLRRLLLVVLIGVTPAVGAAQSDSAGVVHAVEAFHVALASGDSAGALDLLSSDAVILEGGYLETRANYAAGHLSADMAFLAGVTRVVDDRTVTVAGDVAWVSTASLTDGSYQGRDIHSRGAELMVLSRTPDGWRIRAIHWSSGRR